MFERYESYLFADDQQAVRASVTLYKVVGNNDLVQTGR